MDMEALPEFNQMELDFKVPLQNKNQINYDTSWGYLDVFQFYFPTSFTLCLNYICNSMEIFF